MKPVFWYPERIITPPSQDAFMALLDGFNVPYRSWNAPEKKLEKLWLEIESHDAVYISGEAWGKPHQLVRFIITVAVRVVLIIREQGKSRQYVLIEFVLREDGQYHPRKFLDTSASEKMKLLSSGQPAEKPINGIWRLLIEEADTRADLHSLRRGTTFRPYQPSLLERAYPSPMVEWTQRIETHFHEKKGMEGIWHHNQIARYKSRIRGTHYFIGWRTVPGTPYLIRYSSVHETNVLEPMPAELVLLA